MTEPEVFVLADRALDAVVAVIADHQWEMPMPPEFVRRGSSDVPTLRTIIGYHAYDDSWVPDTLAGRTMAEVGDDAHKGDLLESPPMSAREKRPALQQAMNGAETFALRPAPQWNQHTSVLTRARATPRGQHRLHNRSFTQNAAAMNGGNQACTAAPLALAHHELLF